MIRSLLFSLVCCCLCRSARVRSFTPEMRGASRIFLDTADTTEWDELLPTGIFHGVTTNPTLLQRAGEPCTIANLHRMAAHALTTHHNTCNEFMCQAWGETPDDLYQCGMALSQPDRSRIVVKVPVTQEGVEAASRLIQSDVRVCLTACYHHPQAFLAASVGAEYLAPYLGRMDDTGTLDGSAECLKMQAIAEGMKSETRILVASIRRAQTMIDLAAQGMETFTFSPQVARELFVEPLTAQAALEFERAAVESVSSLPQTKGETEFHGNGDAAPPRPPTAEDFGELPEECELEFETDGSISIECEDEFLADSATVSD